MSAPPRGDRVEKQLESVSCLHGTAIAVGEHGLLITGAAGAGKTTLALEMIALGAELVADDQVNVQPDGSGRLKMSSPPAIAGLIEVRGFGLMRLAARSSATLKLIADLDQVETERLPALRKRDLSSVACPVMLCKGKPGLAAALTCLLNAEEWLGADFPA